MLQANPCRFTMLALLFVLGVLLGTAGTQPPAAGQEPKDAKKVALTVTTDFSVSLDVLVELFYEGKQIRTRELRTVSKDTVTWEGLQPGRYEVHISAAGNGKFVKR